MAEETPKKEVQSSFRGLYNNVHISVKTLDKVIIGGILVIVFLLLFGIMNNGYTVSYNSKGGSDVPAQNDVMYGDLLPEPEPPTREGYVFQGWYLDENETQSWDFETNPVEQSMTLYAAWEKETT